MAANDPTPVPIDGGTRLLRRLQATGWEAAVDAAMAAAGETPAGFVLERMVLDADSSGRGRRFRVKVIWRRADVAPQSPGEGRARAEAARARG